MTNDFRTNFISSCKCPSNKFSALDQYIIKKINAYRGAIPFSFFMSYILYAKNLGYYKSDKQKIGIEGDFITAPSFSTLFSKVFAKHFSYILSKLDSEAVIIEFGGGNGQFALECLLYLSSVKKLPKNYIIVEISDYLKNIQKKQLKRVIPEYYSNIMWVKKLPNKKFNAIVFANEFIDAMPVELFCYENNKLSQLMVSHKKNEFTFTKNFNVSKKFQESIDRLPISNFYNIGCYISEVNNILTKWIKAIKLSLKKGVVFICDYGYGRDLYYHSFRNTGTLQCYYKHEVHNNPLINRGLQDVTSHVDFTLVAEKFIDYGFDLEIYTYQGAFLLASGIVDVYNKCSERANAFERLKLLQQLKQLTSVEHMSESFKTMLLSYNIDYEIDCFKKIDSSHLL